MLISQLPAGLKELAKLRGKQEDSYDLRYFDDLDMAFMWRSTPEGHDFWEEVREGNFSVYYGCKVSNFKLKTEK